MDLLVDFIRPTPNPTSPSWATLLPLRELAMQPTSPRYPACKDRATSLNSKALVNRIGGTRSYQLSTHIYFIDIPKPPLSGSSLPLISNQFRPPHSDLTSLWMPEEVSGSPPPSEKHNQLEVQLLEIDCLLGRPPVA